MKKQIIDEIIESIDSAKTISLYGHINLDCDAISSVLIMYELCRKRGKEVDMYIDSDIPARFLYFQNARLIKHEKDYKVHDLSISLDTGDSKRLGAMYDSFILSKNTISIDHHKSHIQFAKQLWLNYKAASTTEMLYDLVIAMGGLNKLIASYIFAGIVTDTGCFAFDSTTKHTHDISGILLDEGINSGEIIQKLYRDVSVNAFKLRNRALSKCEMFDNNKIAFVIFTTKDFRETDTVSSDTEGTINMLLDIETVKIAFAISESEKGFSKVSIRTKDEYNAIDIASKFNGGGHVRAAGCRIDGSPMKAKQLLLDAARSCIK